MDVVYDLRLKVPLSTVGYTRVRYCSFGGERPSTRERLHVSRCVSDSPHGIYRLLTPSSFVGSRADVMPSPNNVMLAIDSYTRMSVRYTSHSIPEFRVVSVSQLAYMSYFTDLQLCTDTTSDSVVDVEQLASLVPTVNVDDYVL
jgi:hypothetical protein